MISVHYEVLLPYSLPGTLALGASDFGGEVRPDFRCCWRINGGRVVAKKGIKFRKKQTDGKGKVDHVTPVRAIARSS